MCVAITLDAGTSLTEEELGKMYRSNQDGFGFAWAEDGLVHWWKTLKVKPAELAHILESFKDHSRIAHFRLSTAGGVNTQLCHPFEIGPTANCRYQGSSEKVMIHNGHWGRWDEVKRLLEREGLLPDDGPWSDSRLAAYLAHEEEEWLHALGGRVATLDCDGKIERIGNWSQLREGVMVSNTIWNYENATPRGGYPGWRERPGWHQEEKEEKDAKAEPKEAVKYVTASKTYTWDPTTKSLVETPTEDSVGSTGEGGKDRKGMGGVEKGAARCEARPSAQRSYETEEEGDLSKGGGTSQAPVTHIGDGATFPCEYTQSAKCGLQDELGGEDCRNEIDYCVFGGEG